MTMFQLLSLCLFVLGAVVFLALRARTWWLICDYQYWTWGGEHPYEWMVTVPKRLWGYLGYSNVLRGNIVGWYQTFAFQLCFVGALGVSLGFNPVLSLASGVPLAVGWFLLGQYCITRVIGWPGIAPLGYHIENMYVEQLLSYRGKKFARLGHR